MADWWNNLQTGLGDALIGVNNPFGLAPPEGFDRNAAMRQGALSLGMNVLANASENPAVALGRGYRQAQALASDNQQNALAAQAMMQAAEDKKRKRQEEEDAKAQREAFLKTLPPDVQMKAKSIPGYLDSYIEATDPALQSAMSPGDRYKAVGSNIYDTQTGQWIASPNGAQGDLPKGYRWKVDGSGAEPIPGVNVQGGTLNATVTKELFEADETASAAENVINTLDSILAPGQGGVSLNDRAGSGALAGWQSWAARNDPFGVFSDETGRATTELSTAITEQALQSLKAIFGGNPTEGERQILLDLQASVDKTPKERAAIVGRARAAAKRRLDFARNKAAAIRNRTYTDPGYDPTVPGSGQPVGSIDGYTIEMLPEDEQ